MGVKTTPKITKMIFCKSQRQRQIQTKTREVIRSRLEDRKYKPNNTTKKIKKVTFLHLVYFFLVFM